MRYSIICVLILVSTALSQSQVCIPDSNPTSGSCVTPIAAQTSVVRLQASLLDPANPRIDDFGVLPCASGTATAANFTLAIGHVPNPLPTTFTMPTFGPGGVTSMGDFLDLAVVHDSAVHGPRVLQQTANAWSYFGFAGTGGTGFTWNLADDVGVYMSFDVVGLQALRYSTTEPLAVSALGYMASTSASAQPSAKVCLQVSPVPQVNTVGAGCPNASGQVAPLFAIGLPSIGNAAFSLGISSAAPTTMATLYPSLGAASTPLSLGSGCDVYIDLISMTDLMAAGFGPFVQTTDLTGQATFSMPVPADPALAGLEVWFQCGVNEPSYPYGVAATNAVQCVIE